MGEQIRRVYFEPAGRMHSAYWEVVRYPPEGYEFVVPAGAYDQATDRVLQSNFVFVTLHRQLLERFLPVHLVKAYVESNLRRPPPGIALTYAQNHLVFRRQPWVVHVEWPTLLTGYSYERFRRYRSTVERALSSPFCRRVLTWCQPARQALLRTLDSAGFADKVEMVPLAVSRKEFAKEYDEGRVKLLFVASADANDFDFHLKGGKEVMAAFSLLRQKYPNLELVVRSPVPGPVKARYQGCPGLRLIEQVIPWAELEGEFKSADIFLLPSHATPWRTILDAMSYELPVVTTDICANGELVDDGVTGFVLPKDARVPFYYNRELLIPIRHTRYRAQNEAALEETDEELVQLLVESVGLLIENEGLRRQMGKRGRWEVEQGRFSIQHRNAILQRIFDAALAE